MRVIQGALNYLSARCGRNGWLVTLEATCAKGGLDAWRQNPPAPFLKDPKDPGGWRAGRNAPLPPPNNPKYFFFTKGF